MALWLATRQPISMSPRHLTSPRDGRPYVCIRQTHTIPIARARALPVVGMAALCTSSRDGRPYVRSKHTLYSITRARDVLCQFLGWPPIRTREQRVLGRVVGRLLVGHLGRFLWAKQDLCIPSVTRRRSTGADVSNERWSQRPVA